MPGDDYGRDGEDDTEDGCQQHECPSSADRCLEQCRCYRGEEAVPVKQVPQGDWIS